MEVSIVLLITISSCLFSFAVLMRHILLKRKIYHLRLKMKDHVKTHGVNDELYDLFNKESRKLLRFWSAL